MLNVILLRGFLIGSILGIASAFYLKKPLSFSLNPRHWFPSESPGKYFPGTGLVMGRLGFGIALTCLLVLLIMHARTGTETTTILTPERIFYLFVVPASLKSVFLQRFIGGGMRTTMLRRKREDSESDFALLGTRSSWLDCCISVQV